MPTDRKRAAAASEDAPRAAIVNRLNRIAGQVAGVGRMVEDDRYCIDILTQIEAVKAALSKAEDEILKAHAAHCVAAAIKSGDREDQARKFAELIDLFARTKR